MRNNTEAQKFILIQLQTYNNLLAAANESNQKPQTAKEILLTKKILTKAMSQPNYVLQPRSMRSKNRERRQRR